MRTVTLVTFNDRNHAQPVVDRLQQAGFHPEVSDESAWQSRHFAEHLASVKVRVGESEYEPARQQLKEWDQSGHWLDQAVNCPECGSPDVDYPQVTRKFVLPALHALLYKFHIAEKEFYCHTCHHTWPTRIKMEAERNALNWPVKKSPLRENPDVTP